MSPSADEVADLVISLVSSPWPTTEAERVAGFAAHGLAGEVGVPLTGLPDSFSADCLPGWGGATFWSIYRGEFLGLWWFLWAGDDDAVTEDRARRLRRAFDRQWPGVDAVDDAPGFTSLWRPGEREIDMNHHAPRDLGDGRTAAATVQLHVSHRGRAAARETEARAGRPRRQQEHGRDDPATQSR